MSDWLSLALTQHNDTRIAVAFISRSGLDLIMPALESNIKADGYVEFLVGLDMHNSDPKALQILYDFSLNHTNMFMYCHTSLIQGIIYHPKLYLFRQADTVLSIIGSSNLTKSGLRKNIEVNVAITTESYDDVVTDAYETYNRLKFHQNRVIPDQKFLDLYSKLFTHKNKSNTDSNKSTSKLIQEFKTKVNSMQKPMPTKRDLVGWLETVYDMLPNGEFKNEDVYQFQSTFQAKFPNNKNIKAKIRQQLQFLRDMGLIEHLGKAHWRKL